MLLKSLVIFTLFILFSTAQAIVIYPGEVQYISSGPKNQKIPWGSIQIQAGNEFIVFSSRNEIPYSRKIEAIQLKGSDSSIPVYDLTGNLIVYEMDNYGKTLGMTVNNDHDSLLKYITTHFPSSKFKKDDRFEAVLDFKTAYNWIVRLHFYNQDALIDFVTSRPFDRQYERQPEPYVLLGKYLWSCAKSFVKKPEAPRPTKVEFIQDPKLPASIDDV